jgi:hypothetical protein
MVSINNRLATFEEKSVLEDKVEEILYADSKKKK